MLPITPANGQDHLAKPADPARQSDRAWRDTELRPHIRRVFDASRQSHARKIVGWRVSTSPHAGFDLDAFHEVVHECRPAKGMGLVHHWDRGSQFVSIRYPEQLAEAGIEPSGGSGGDSYDNALAETINGLFKAEIILRRDPWSNVETVEHANLERVDRFSNPSQFHSNQVPSNL